MAQLDSTLRAQADLERFAGVVRVERGGRLALERAYGLANRQGRVANRTDTRFDAGALGEQLTAAAVLQLAERGAVRMDAALDEYLPQTHGARAGSVTLRQLLAHEAGITELRLRNVDQWLKPPGVAPRDLSGAELVDSLADWVGVPPSSAQTDFSTSGYGLLAAVVERVSGEPFERYVQEHLLRPAEMTESELAFAPRELALRAVGYHVDSGRVLGHAGAHASYRFGVGGLYTTGRDLSRWVAALREGRLLSEASLRTFCPALIAGAGVGKADTLRRGVACGAWWSRDSTVVVTLGGGDQRARKGAHAYVAVAPAAGDVAILLGNLTVGYYPWRQAQSLEWGVNDALFEHRRPWLLDLYPSVAKLPGGAMRAFEGQYDFSPGLPLYLTLRDGGLWARSGGPHAWTLWHVPGLFRSAPAAHAALADSLVAALVRQDFANAARMVASGNVGDSPAALRRLWEALTAVTGPIRGRGVGFSQQSDPSVSYAIARLEGERGTARFTFAVGRGSVWQLEWGPDGLPAEVPLTPLGDGRLLVDGVRFDRPDIFLTPARDLRGRPNGLTLRLQNTVAEARRTAGRMTK